VESAGIRSGKEKRKIRGNTQGSEKKND